MPLAFARVAVTPEHELFEHEKPQNTGQQRPKHSPGVLRQVQGFRYEREQRDTEQGTNGVADELWNGRQARSAEKQEENRREQKSAKAAYDTEAYSGRERVHARMIEQSTVDRRVDGALSPDCLMESPRNRAERGRDTPSHEPRRGIECHWPSFGPGAG